MGSTKQVVLDFRFLKTLSHFLDGSSCISPIILPFRESSILLDQSSFFPAKNVDIFASFGQLCSQHGFLALEMFNLALPSNKQSLKIGDKLSSPLMHHFNVDNTRFQDWLAYGPTLLNGNGCVTPGINTRDNCLVDRPFITRGLVIIIASTSVHATSLATSSVHATSIATSSPFPRRR